MDINLDLKIRFVSNEIVKEKYDHKKVRPKILCFNCAIRDVIKGIQVTPEVFDKDSYEYIQIYCDECCDETIPYVEKTKKKKGLLK
jgi:hypothetical protein